MSINRRTILTGMAALSATGAAREAFADSSPQAPDSTETPSVDVLLAKTTPAERARYHATALAEAMNEEIPGLWVARINWSQRCAIILDEAPIPGRGRS